MANMGKLKRLVIAVLLMAKNACGVIQDATSPIRKQASSGKAALSKMMMSPDLADSVSSHEHIDSKTEFAPKIIRGSKNLGQVAFDGRVEVDSKMKISPHLVREFEKSGKVAADGSVEMSADIVESIAWPAASIMRDAKTRKRKQTAITSKTMGERAAVIEVMNQDNPTSSPSACVGYVQEQLRKKCHKHLRVGCGNCGDVGGVHECETLCRHTAGCTHFSQDATAPFECILCSELPTWDWGDKPNSASYSLQYCEDCVGHVQEQLRKKCHKHLRVGCGNCGDVGGVHECETRCRQTSGCTHFSLDATAPFECILCSELPTWDWGDKPNSASYSLQSCEACATNVWPKDRSCAIRLGSGSSVGGYEYTDGTGSWCGAHKGSMKASLEEAMMDCSVGSFQNFVPPCQGVVYNGAEPGDEGTAYGQYTTCWKNVADGKGWQILLRPVAPTPTSSTLPTPTPPTPPPTESPTAACPTPAAFDPTFAYPGTSLDSYYNYCNYMVTATCSSMCTGTFSNYCRDECELHGHMQASVDDLAQANKWGWESVTTHPYKWSNHHKDQYDCFTKETWPTKKRDWCCNEKQLGCENYCNQTPCTQDICPDGKPRRHVGTDCCSCDQAACPTPAAFDPSFAYPGTSLDSYYNYCKYMVTATCSGMCTGTFSNYCRDECELHGHM